MKKLNVSHLGYAVLLTASSALIAVSPTEAISLIGNFSSTNDTRGNTISAPGGLGGQRAVGFTLPSGTSYILNNIRLRLDNYNTVSDGDVALLRIYRDDTGGSTDPLGAILESVTFNASPTSNANTAATFTFTPTTPSFTFFESTRYWLLVDSSAPNTSDFRWRGDNTANPQNTSGGITPTGLATLVSYVGSFDDGATYTATANTTGLNGPFNSFDIDVTVIPFEFESSLGILGIGSLWLGRKYLKKKK